MFEKLFHFRVGQNGPIKNRHGGQRWYRIGSWKSKKKTEENEYEL